MPSFSFILLKISEKKNFEYIFENLPFMSPRQLIKSSDLDKSRIKHGGLLYKHFCNKKIPNIPNDLAEIVNFHFSHYKGMESLSCHSNQSSYLTEIKHITFVEGYVLSKYAKFRLHPPYALHQTDGILRMLRFLVVQACLFVMCLSRCDIWFHSHLFISDEGFDH